MIWVTWRQHRAQAIVCLACSARWPIFAITSAPGCAARSPATGSLPAWRAAAGPAARRTITSFVNQFNHGLSRHTCRFSRFPGCSGSWWRARCSAGNWSGAPGGWPGPRPCRGPSWLAAKLGLVTGGLVVFGAAVTVLMSWFRGPLDQVTSRLQPGLSSPRG